MSPINCEIFFNKIFGFAYIYRCVRRFEVKFSSSTLSAKLFSLSPGGFCNPQHKRSFTPPNPGDRQINSFEKHTCEPCSGGKGTNNS